MANTHNIAVSWRDETQRIGWPKFPGLFRDGVKIDATSESHTGVLGSQNETSFGFWHNGGTNIKAVLVFVYQGMLGTAFASNDYTTGVTYGGISMTEIAAGRATDTGAEQAAIKTFIINDLSNISTGRQFVTVFRTSNDVHMYAVCITLTADNLLEVTGVRIQEQNQVANSVLVTDGFSSGNGTSSLRLAAAWTGDGTQLTANSETTILQSLHTGSNGFIAGAETTPGMGERLVGFFKALADDFAAVYLAVREQNVSLEPARRQEGLLATLAKPAIVGKPFEGHAFSTFNIPHTSGINAAYTGGILSLNGEVHFVPYNANMGTKVNRLGALSTYSLVYTENNAFDGGVLAPDGTIHFIPTSADRGQKITANNSVSTYSLVYTTSSAYVGGVVAQNGDIYFAPHNATVGQKISPSGAVSTYSLVYTTTGAYVGGCLLPNGEVHFVPYNAVVGQKIAPDGTVSTYSLIYTVSNAYRGGVLAPNGDTHFMPYSAQTGQKLSPSGVVSTYTLVVNAGTANYWGGVLAPNGDIHMVPWGSSVGQKIAANGIVSTYAIPNFGSSAFNNGFWHNDALFFVPRLSSVPAMRIHTPSGRSFNRVVLSPYLNKV